ncbi:MAG: GNAT family N-acetyltransferase [Coriobacteriales bacterium]|nr:GNAT family N-acetyltransferase [Coriobacteriales bacterium]
MATLKELGSSDYEEIKALFRSVFTQPPWNDDWSNEAQLDEYLQDLMGARTPLTLGLIENGELIGVSLGNIRHWYEGTEYYVDELCIRTDLQGKGYGTQFLALIEEHLKGLDLHVIYLTTDRDVPAFPFYLSRGFKEAPTDVALYKTF